MAIQKSNKLIDDFMRAKTWIIQGELCINNKEGSPYPLVDYHVSWNSLMPVVEKIERMSVKYSCVALGPDLDRPIKYSCQFMCYAQKRWGNKNYFIKGKLAKTRLDTTYSAIVKFLLWYNKALKSMNDYRVYNYDRWGNMTSIIVQAMSHKEAKEIAHIKNSRGSRNQYCPYKSTKTK